MDVMYEENMHHATDWLELETINSVHEVYSIGYLISFPSPQFNNRRPVLKRIRTSVE